ncbi:MAG: 16S rRNA (cytidine(1402)-2'-O)-methyltransferase [Bacilli bacterium]|nr:16S rRNA (cytidine(1402)-2'-O)-methyltransferase [Bacilli bacterium]MDD4809085.1 16S rRNA (cytidine(1402)-2'-O)-methyltransferase [Bacilli bacterium]
MSQKSYDNSPTLYLIPTPIGNMDDITLRAINVLKEVKVIFSEDTRVTGLLLKKLEIKKKMIANHEHNEKKNLELALNYLSSGDDIALVSDRGTPIISDPGYEMAKYVIEKGYNVVSLPGATALIPALTMSGIKPMPFLFYGFLNSTETKRKEELESLEKETATLIFYEAPHRIQKTLGNVLDIMGNREICISREITKKYEEVFRGSVKSILEQIVDIKGEIVLMVAGNNTGENYDNWTLIEHIEEYIADGYKVMDAIKAVSKDRHLKKSDVYNEYLKYKGR